MHVEKYKCEKCKRVCNKVNGYIKKHKLTSNRNVKKHTNKPNKYKIYKSNKYIEMCIKMNMKIYKYIEMHVEKYLFEIIKEYVKNKV